MKYNGFNITDFKIEPETAAGECVGCWFYKNMNCTTIEISPFVAKVFSQHHGSYGSCKGLIAKLK